MISSIMVLMWTLFNMILLLAAYDEADNPPSPVIPINTGYLIFYNGTQDYSLQVRFGFVRAEENREGC